MPIPGALREAGTLLSIPLATRAFAPPCDWAGGVYGPKVLLRRQLIRLSPDAYLILHRDLFLERYFHGLVHLLDDAARSGVVHESWQHVRIVFGHLFEGYIRWLLRRFFAGCAARYGESIERIGDTDALVVVGRTALVLECNHHYLSTQEAYNCTPATLSEIVRSDLAKAIATARAIARGQVFINGTEVQVDHVLPIAVIPDPLPVNPMTCATFHQALSDGVPGLDGDGAGILPAQVLTQSHFEFYDRVWRLPADAQMLVDHLTARARSESSQFTSRREDRATFGLRGIHDGNLFGPLEAAAHREFQATGPSRFSMRDG